MGTFAAMAASLRRAMVSRRTATIGRCRPPKPTSGERGWVNEARGQIASHDQQTLALDPRCGGPARANPTAGPKSSFPELRPSAEHLRADRSRQLAPAGLRHRESCVWSHMFKAGASFTYLDQRARTPLEFGGSFTFAPLPAIPGVLSVPVSALGAFALGLPALYVRGFGNSAGPFTYQELTAFAQDDWRLTSRLTLKAGLRYQVQIWPDTETTVTSAWRHVPSLSVSAGPQQPGAASRDVVQSGSHRSQLYRRRVRPLLWQSACRHPGLADSLRRLTGWRQAPREPFPASVAAWQAPGHRIPEPIVPFPSSVVTVAPGMKSPYAHQASIGWNQEFGDRLRLSASLVYVGAEHQIGSVNYNPLVPALGPGAGRMTSVASPEPRPKCSSSPISVARVTVGCSSHCDAG